MNLHEADVNRPPDVYQVTCSHLAAAVWVFGGRNHLSLAHVFKAVV